MEFTLLFAVLTAVAAMWGMVRLLRSRLEGIDSPIDALIGSAAIGLISGRLAAMLADGVNPLAHPLEVILVRAGVMTEVAAPVAVIALLWIWRRHLPSWADAVTSVALAGLAGWHAGCVWRGTCLGSVSDLPWAFGIAGSDVTRHPVEIYAALLLLAAIPLVLRIPAAPWRATGLVIAVAGAARLVTQPLRPSLTGGPVVFYAIALVAGLAIAIAGPLLRTPQDLTV